MKLKTRPEDFRVRELLREGFLAGSGPHRVYRVRKRKLTSLQAAAALAREAGVPAAEVSMAGLKDRQGVTEQHMSVPGGRPVSVRSRELRIELVGSAREPLSSEDSLGNAFEIVIRALSSRDVERVERELPRVREHGLPNYFDAQRFRNLEQHQGWIARDLAEGKHERALRRLLTGYSDFAQEKERRFKETMKRSWGDWKACRRAAGVFGSHHSVFEHLARHPDDFAGAFRHVSSRLRLIHLYAFQSHLWNRAVADVIFEAVPRRSLVILRGPEGPLPAPRFAAPHGWTEATTFRLPGPGLADVRHEGERAAFERVLGRQGLIPSQLSIDGVPGFQLKGEDRRVWLRPGALEVSGPAADGGKGFRLELAFELPRGSYATLVVQRLLGGWHGPRPGRRPAGGGGENRPGQRREDAPKRYAAPAAEARSRRSGDGRHGKPRARRGRDEGRRAPR